MSVIVPVFNGAPFFREAVESVLAQDFRDFELLLADDGSTDGSTEIARQFERADPDRIKYLEHEGHANLGINATRNLGLRAARGEIVGFIDADDRWRPFKLSEQVDLFDRHPDVAAVCGAVNYWSSWNGGRDRIYRTGRGQDRKVRPPDALLSWYPFGKATSPSMSDIMFRREAVLATGEFAEEFQRGHTEYSFLTKFYLSETIYVSSRVWSDYRQHEGSCMAVLTNEGAAESTRVRFLKWFEDYLAGSAHRDSLPVNMAVQRALRPRPWSALAGALRKRAAAVRGGRAD